MRGLRRSLGAHLVLQTLRGGAVSSGFHIDIDELESLKCRVKAIASAQRAIVRPAQPGAEVFGCDGIDDAIGVLLDGGRQRHQDGALWRITPRRSKSMEPVRRSLSRRHTRTR